MTNCNQRKESQIGFRQGHRLICLSLVPIVSCWIPHSSAPAGRFLLPLNNQSFCSSYFTLFDLLGRSLNSIIPWMFLILWHWSWLPSDTVPIPPMFTLYYSILESILWFKTTGLSSYLRAVVLLVVAQCNRPWVLVKVLAAPFRFWVSIGFQHLSALFSSRCWVKVR